MGTHARDKDAVVAVMALCEAAAYYKSQGKTLCDRMKELFERYGYFREELCTVTLKGQDGAKKIKEMMENVRNNVPKDIGGLKVLQFRDYQKDVLLDCVTGEKCSTGLLTSDVLYFELEGGAWCCVRPSGTEPKIKFYIGVRGQDEADAERQAQSLKSAVEQMAK